MSQNSSSNNPFGMKMFDMDLMKNMMSANTMMPFDFGAIIESQRKNIQAFTEAQQVAMESMQEIGQRQANMLSKLVESNTTLAQQIMTEGTPEEKVARQADLLCQALETSMESWRDLADAVNKSNKEASDILGKRVTSSLSEFKSSMEKKQSKEKSAA